MLGNSCANSAKFGLIWRTLARIRLIFGEFGQFCGLFDQYRLVVGKLGRCWLEICSPKSASSASWSDVFPFGANPANMHGSSTQRCVSWPPMGWGPPRQKLESQFWQTRMKYISNKTSCLFCCCFSCDCLFPQDEVDAHFKHSSWMFGDERAAESPGSSIARSA